MSKRFFKKSLLSQNVFKDRNGGRIGWEQLGGNTGVIALDSDIPAQAQLIEDLSKVVGRLGVSETDDDGYQGLKKNRQGRRYAPKLNASGGPVRIVSRDLRLTKAARPAVDAAAPQQPQLSDAPPADTVPRGNDQQLAKAVVPPPRKVGRPRKAQVTTEHQRSESVFLGPPAAAPA